MILAFLFIQRLFAIDNGVNVAKILKVFRWTWNKQLFTS